MNTRWYIRAATRQKRNNTKKRKSWIMLTLRYTADCLWRTLDWFRKILVSMPA
jgi:hypothetical protein